MLGCRIKRPLTFERELHGLKSAMDELSLSTGTIVTWDDETIIEKKIKVIPIWKWLLILIN